VGRDGHDHQQDLAGFSGRGVQGGSHPEQGQHHGRVGVRPAVVVVMMVVLVMVGLVMPSVNRRRYRPAEVIEGMSERPQNGHRHDQQVNREQIRRAKNPAGWNLVPFRSSALRGA
jgi:hypothetical protein